MKKKNMNREEKILRARRIKGVIKKIHKVLGRNVTEGEKEFLDGLKKVIEERGRKVIKNGNWIKPSDVMKRAEEELEFIFSRQSIGIWRGKYFNNMEHYKVVWSDGYKYYYYNWEKIKGILEDIRDGTRDKRRKMDQNKVEG